MQPEINHLPVMVDEILSFLKPKSKEVYLDCTFGQGGVSKKILNQAKCKVIAIDRDIESKIFAEKIKKKFNDSFFFNLDKFSNIEKILSDNKVKKINGLILDLGVSNTQLNNPSRGFSFSNNGPLDMRMDKNSELTAEKVVNHYSEIELSDIFFYYGDEKNARKIARRIVEQRKKKKISTTFDLVKLIKQVNSYNNKNPSTRVFQSLRIFVNDELKELDFVLKKSKNFLAKNSKIITIAFHSLEDKIIKNFFKKNKELFIVLTKRPVKPSTNEIKKNPRSRSAKLRVAKVI